MGRNFLAITVYPLLLFLFACGTSNKELDIQGHRGARGLLHENSIPGFIKALELGVNTLEMDLSVTKDSVLILSHEPYFSPEFCSDPNGVRVSKDTIFNIYQMNFEDVLQFDCGSIVHPRFPDQEKIATVKPRLIDVLDTVNKYVDSKQLPDVWLNIELKTTKEGDNIFHPEPAVFSEMVYAVLSQANVLDKTIIQSFDFRTLQYFNEKYPDVKLALLIYNRLPWRENIDSLGFYPNIYSCDYQLLSRTVVNQLQQNNMKVIPWTVNNTDDMKDLISWGVDGIITDYPDRLINLK